MGLSWGLHFVMIKIASCQCSPLFLLFPTFAGISTVFLLLNKLEGKKLTINRGVIKFLVIAGLLGYFFPIYTELLAAAHIDAGLLTLLVTMTPLITIFVAGISKTERIHLRQIIASGLGTIGLLLLFIPTAAMPAESMRLWALVALFVPISYAVYNVYVAKYWPSSLTPLQLATGESIASTIIALPFFLLDLTEAQVTSAYENWDLICAVVLVTAVEVWAFFELIKRAGPIYVSFSSFVTLLSGYFWGWLLLDEQITSWMFFSSIFLLLSFIVLHVKFDPITKSQQKGNVS